MQILSSVVINLHSPKEKVWGVLIGMNPSGVTVRGIDLNSFDDWSRAVASGEDSLGLSTVFFPIHRVERILLDETVGGIPSYTETFESRTGKGLLPFLGLDQERAVSGARQLPGQSHGQRGKAKLPRKRPGR
jgi:hypothetical protein